MPDKVLITKSKLDSLADAISSKFTAGSPLTIDQMEAAIDDVQIMPLTVTPNDEQQVFDGYSEEIVLPVGTYVNVSQSTSKYLSSVASITFDNLTEGETYLVSGTITRNGITITLSGEFVYSFVYSGSNYTYTKSLIFSPTRSENNSAPTWIGFERYPANNNICFSIYGAGYASLVVSSDIVFAHKTTTGYLPVTVAPIPSEYIIPTGTKTITENGTGIDVTQYAAVDIQTTPSLQEKTVTPTGYTQIIEADGPESITTGDFSESGTPTYNSPNTTGYYSIPIDLSSIISGKSYHVTGSGSYTAYSMTNYTYTIDSDWWTGEPIPLVFSPTTSNFLSLTWHSSGLVATFSTDHSQQDRNIKFSGNLTFTAKEGGYDGLSSVTVEAIPSGGGGGTTPAPIKDVNFIDYDGTILYSYTKAEFAQLSSLPANPDHSGDDIPLTSQGWNWTLQQINTQLTATPDQSVWVGQMYVTTDGKTYIDIELHEGRLSPYLGIAVNGIVVVDWGDNAATSTVTGSSLSTQIRTLHEYAAAGKYRISISAASGSFAFYGTSSYSLLSVNSSVANANRVYANAVQFVRVGNSASINSYAFINCCSLASITIPSGVTGIGAYVFQYCYSLASITIPSGVTSINTYTFNNCCSLTSITIPSGVTVISSNTFNNCYSLASITIPSGVTSIGTYTFYNCYSIESITMPSGITSIDSNTFTNCYSLASITIPSGVTSINSSVFNGCHSLTSITIPSGVTVIGAAAFYNCYGLAELHFLSTTPPTASNSTVFTNVSTDCVIYVPTGSLSAYTSATNYPSSSTYTYREE